EIPMPWALLSHPLPAPNPVGWSGALILATSARLVKSTTEKLFKAPRLRRYGDPSRRGYPQLLSDLIQYRTEPPRRLPSFGDQRRLENVPRARQRRHTCHPPSRRDRAALFVPGCSLPSREWWC